jgi:hypothetical protein
VVAGRALGGQVGASGSFAADPPPGVVPVSFFITARLAGQNTSEAFLRDVTADLEALAPTGQQPRTSAEQPVHYLQRLFRERARDLAGNGRRLVLVVDGLDEDNSRAAGRPSIASMLPKRPEHGSKVIVSSRRNLPVPGDVAEDHPLHQPGAVRELPVSAHAVTRRQAAGEELGAHCLALPATAGPHPVNKRKEPPGDRKDSNRRYPSFSRA